MEIRLRLRPFLIAGTLLLSLAACAGATEAASAPSRSPFTGWTWLSGSNSINQLGVYGTQGVASPDNTPGARVSPVSAVDLSGNFWLFGGYGNDSANAQGGDLNDLWEYSDGEWTWVSGSNLTEQSGTYGSRGIAAPGNVPGARYQALSWIDTSGNLWIFGGLGIDSTGARGRLNDLWKYSAGEWTWMSGAATADQKGEYGTKGAAAGSNVPGARVSGSTWTDAAGDLWLFGGFGYDSNGNLGILNDLWEYEPSTGEWTWVSGANVIDQSAVFGTEGTPDPGNVPSSRFDGQTWADAHGNLWLFGGEVYCAQCGRGSNTYGNDLWEFNPTTVEWTWVSGTNEVNQPGVYGTEGTPAAGNMPPYTAEATTWTDAAGAFWMFAGGSNILWRYSGGQWTWIDGVPPTQCCSNPYYGTLGTPGPNNIPGGRILTVQWMDGFGNAWIFGGYGEDSEGNDNPLNDLWRYSPGVNEWTWMGGSNVVNQKGVYGTKGVAAPGNIPGARWDAISWTDSSGNFWLFGGDGYDSNGTDDLLNDLWEFKP